MNPSEHFKILQKAFEDNQLGDLITNENAKKLVNFSEILTKANETTNLTAITDKKEIILKHFIDSASISKHIPAGSKVIDVGCGAGFPSIPLAILRQDIDITSLDSTGKKVDFVSYAANELKIQNIDPVCARAEELSSHREQYDVCTSRAVARLNILSELCLPFVKVCGKFIAMKSSKGVEEYNEAKNGIFELGGILSESENPQFSLDNSTINREIYVIAKTNKTPAAYPRKYSQILKKPL